MNPMIRSLISPVGMAIAAWLSVAPSAIAASPQTPGRLVDFSLKDLDGKVHRLADYRGKWVVVNYWATWCPPCIEEMPALDEFHNKHKDTDAVVLGVNTEGTDVAKLRPFVESLMVTYPILRDRPRQVSELGFVEVLPTTFLVSPEGRVVAFVEGMVAPREIEAYIARKAGARGGERRDIEVR